MVQQFINSLAPGKFELNLNYVILKRILMIDVWAISCEIALMWVSLDFPDDQSTLVQVMALVPSGNKPLPEPMLTQIYVAIWCHSATMWWIVLRKIQIYLHCLSFHWDGRSDHLFHMKDKDMLVPHCQYHGSWWPGVAKSQGISSHSIDVILPEYSSLSTTRLND